MSKKNVSISPKGGLTGKAGLAASVACGLTALAVVALSATSCNVVRTITNRSECYQRGDTSVMIQTKTTEAYDAKKYLP